MIASAVASNYMSFARVLGKSLRRHTRDVALVVAVTDDACGQFDPANEPFEVVGAEELSIPELVRFRFSHSRRETAIAAKPYLLDALLDAGYETVVYIDADMLVLADVSTLVREVGRHAVTLVPHLLDPPSVPDHARELTILRSGTYNGGVLGVQESAEARLFLAWFKQRLHTRCIGDPAGGLHYDQRWLDLVPAFVADVGVIRDRGCNVAHWNLQERPVRIVDDVVTAGGAPCSLFHFSGFTPERPRCVSNYRPGLAIEDVGGDAPELFEQYNAALLEAGWATTSTWPYPHAVFDNGVRIPDFARALYRDLGDDARSFGDPFRAQSSGTFFEWLRDHGGDDERPVNRLWRAVYDSRLDLQAVFPDALGEDWAAFREWIEAHGMREHDVPHELV